MGKREGNRRPVIGLCVLVLGMLAGCASAFRAHPQLHEKVQSIHTVAIMPPGIKVYQLAASGGTQLMDESTAAAKQIVSTAIEKELGRHAGVVFKPFPSPSALLDTNSNLTARGLKDELEDPQALFETMSATVLLHTYKHNDFEYSLGPDVERLAKLANADALLFTSGVEHIPTGGRETLVALGGLLCTFGAIFNPIGAATQCFPGLSGALGQAILNVALVDATTGAILWHNVGGFQDGYSLTNSDSVANLAAQAFEDFPLGMRPTRKEYDRGGSARLGGALQ